MNIIQISPGYPPSIGGVQHVVQKISLGLAKLGHTIDVFTCSERGSNSRTLKIRNLNVHFLKNFVIGHTPIAPTLLFKLIAIPSDSIMHVHISKAFLPEIVYLVSRIRSIPYVAHFHLDIGPSGKLGFLLALYKKVFLSIVLKNASRVVVLSENYRKIIKDKYGLSKNVVVIPNGVGEEFFLKHHTYKHKGNVNLLFVGRISIQKNVDNLIEAVSLIKSKATLNIVGEGELLPQMRKLILSKRLTNVHLRGCVKGKKLIGYYRNADIFLLASKQEGLPLVLLEAMAAGVPVIASDVVGNHEFVGNAGILVSPSTPAVFAKEIDRLIANRELAYTLAQRGRKKSLEYKWVKIIKQFEKIYNEIYHENN